PTPPPPCSTLFPYTTLFRSYNIRHHQTPAPAAFLSTQGRAEETSRYTTALTVPSPPHSMNIHLTQNTLARLGNRNTGCRCDEGLDRKSTRLNSCHVSISYAV